MFSQNLKAKIDCNQHPIFCQIKTNRPDVSYEFAMKLSNIIYSMHHKYHVPSRVFTAILMQESRYDLSAKGCTTGYRTPTDHETHYAMISCKSLNQYSNLECEYRSKKLIKSKVCADFGIAQINYKTASRFGFDIDLLTTDLEYSVEAGAQVLNDFQERYESKELDWWTRYNSSNKIKRRIYGELVEKYM